ncbi:MAG: hypothetical protein AAFX07_17270 [Pseudomonadota bacterium]
MHNILYFPHYTPSTVRLRSLLLFYDELRSIVPHVDQRHVTCREHVAELLDVGCQIDYYDPSYRYSDWLDDDKVRRVFKRLVDSCSKKAKKIRAFNEIKFDEFGAADWNQDDAIHEFTARGWSLIAAQKIPQSELEKLRQKK